MVKDLLNESIYTAKQVYILYNANTFSIGRNGFYYGTLFPIWCFTSNMDFVLPMWNVLNNFTNMGMYIWLPFGVCVCVWLICAICNLANVSQSKWLESGYYESNMLSIKSEHLVRMNAWVLFKYSESSTRQDWIVTNSFGLIY